MTLRQLVRSDVERYVPEGAPASASSLVRAFALNQGAWASVVYRVAHALSGRRDPAGRFGYGLSLIAYKWIEIVAGISLAPRAAIGPGLYVGHFGGVIVSPDAALGAHCNLNHGATLGVARRGGRWGAPRLGDRVWVGAHAVLAGPIVVGDDAAIGPNCVVYDDVPPRAVLRAAAPDKVSDRGSFAWVRYPGADDDPARRASLDATNGDRPLLDRG